MKKVLIAGAYGQVGQELIRALATRIGMQNIICTDLREPPPHLNIRIHEHLNALDKPSYQHLIEKHHVTQIYCLAALLSATGQLDPLKTQKINMTALFNVLELARQGKVKKVFWPSSIAAFGKNAPKKTQQYTIMDPGTVYGITKKSGEMWCQYYNDRYGIDIRSIRYPGLVGYRSPPGGGTTDYAVDIFHKAILGQPYYCYLKEDAYLPMIYTDDAIRATIELMEAPSQNITVRTSYNVHGMSFCPSEVAAQIKKHLPNFDMRYDVAPHRQKIAESWPYEMVDTHARQDWGWKEEYDLPKMVKQILTNLTPEMIKRMES